MAGSKKNAFVLLATDFGSMLVNRFDYHISDGNTFGVGHELLQTSSYENDVMPALLVLLSRRREFHGDGVFAIDCGANIGVYTLAIARHMIGWGEVLAVEAQERIFYALAGNIVLNNLFNARAIWTAVSDRIGTIEIPKTNYLEPASFGSLELEPRAGVEFIGQPIDYAAGRGQIVNMTTLDAFDFPRLDFIKIDVENMEIKVLVGARQMLIKHKPIILVEHIKSNSNELSGFLTHLGYRIIVTRMNFVCVHQTDPVANMLQLG